jgi:hypothetical protein
MEELVSLIREIGEWCDESWQGWTCATMIQRPSENTLTSDRQDVWLLEQQHPHVFQMILLSTLTLLTVILPIQLVKSRSIHSGFLVVAKVDHP